ncbi:cupredoxin domain-containing protein [Rhodopila sp.]|uniref:cupredoxin domain-containing protein n=1 Tax=Rhodopila sp. TaxID=2480087 RepID=UPI002CC33311|nr:cupredoxin family copper-binding protein [Rhodopila sp.]HVZ07413.1 cupredoxin family copper-binding protein [Rhodopila sp.]
MSLKAMLSGSAIWIACHGSGRSSAAARITIDNFAFSPAMVTVAPGTEVTWRNDDDIPHSIVLTDGSDRSKALDTNDTFSHRFDKPGQYAYICGLHPHMHGDIVVR